VLGRSSTALAGQRATMQPRTEQQRLRAVAGAFGPRAPELAGRMWRSSVERSVRAAHQPVAPCAKGRRCNVHQGRRGIAASSRGCRCFVVSVADLSISGPRGVVRSLTFSHLACRSSPGGRAHGVPAGRLPDRSAVNRPACRLSASCPPPKAGCVHAREQARPGPGSPGCFADAGRRQGSAFCDRRQMMGLHFGLLRGLPARHTHLESGGGGLPTSGGCSGSG
jgi:hypothetical protein